MSDLWAWVPGVIVGLVISWAGDALVRRRRRRREHDRTSNKSKR